MPSSTHRLLLYVYIYKRTRTHAFYTYIIQCECARVCVLCVKLGNIITPCIVDRSKCICLSGPTPTPSTAAARPMEISSSGFAAAAAAAVHCFIINTQQLITGSDTDTDRRRTRFSFESNDLLSARLFFPLLYFSSLFYFPSSVFILLTLCECVYDTAWCTFILYCMHV